MEGLEVKGRAADRPPLLSQEPVMLSITQNSKYTVLVWISVLTGFDKAFVPVKSRSQCGFGPTKVLVLVRLV